jgi:hypothetical protein
MDEIKLREKISILCKKRDVMLLKIQREQEIFFALESEIAVCRGRLSGLIDGKKRTSKGITRYHKNAAILKIIHQIKDPLFSMEDIKAFIKKEGIILPIIVDLDNPSDFYDKIITPLRKSNTIIKDHTKGKTAYYRIRGEDEYV